MVKIAPSILAADLLNIKNEVINVDNAGAEFIHIDIMDGHFVPNLSFGYNMVKTLRPITNKILDVHLMISPVEPFIKEFIDAGSDIISFHPEADKNTKEIISTIKKSNCKVGIAVHPNIKIEEIKEFLNDVDLVIIMTVIPGFGGQKFLEDQVNKISALKEIRKNINANYEIEIDGGINYQTSKICIDKGADILVTGSYVYGAPKEEYKDKINSIRHLT
ncbi:ribulose-phosphate 3-epimerase [Alphaproteobacteria bacterium]|nr:ribulose-phosphate 3-epimerase [Alphaproteobacteria bacterium]